jgi:hypothetical protein
MSRRTRDGLRLTTFVFTFFESRSHFHISYFYCERKKIHGTSNIKTSNRKNQRNFLPSSHNLDPVNFLTSLSSPCFSTGTAAMFQSGDVGKRTLSRRAPEYRDVSKAHARLPAGQMGCFDVALNINVYLGPQRSQRLGGFPREKGGKG